uniref:Angio-associated migratory cell protein n=1 Tax=Aceria tosichella TaxID=561515 RepID=A0A6G1SCZ0_9ACAR
MEEDFNKPTTSNHYADNTSLSPNTSGVFSRHTDSVLCCSIDNRTRLAVSGGIDDTAYVWDLNTTHVIFECVDHKESVVAAAFSANSTYVATGDLNGYIQVRNTTTGIKVFEYEIDEINWIIWHSSSDFVLIAGTTKGDIWMWNVNDPSAVKTFSSYGSSCTTARLLPDGMKMAVAYADGSLRVFDLKSKQPVSKLSEPGNSEIITIDINPKKSVLAIGCLNSSIKLLTLEYLRPIGQLFCKTPAEFKSSYNPEDAVEPMDQGIGQQDDAVDESDDKDNSTESQGASSEDIEVVDEYSKVAGEPDKEGEGETSQNVEEDDEDDVCSSNDEEVDHSESVETVRFSPCGEYLAAANNSGTIVFWDVSSLAVRCEKHTSIGISRAAWTNNGLYITGCLDGRIRVYDINLKEVRVIAAHTDQVLDLALKDGLIVSASEDKTCRVSRL